MNRTPKLNTRHRNPWSLPTNTPHRRELMNGAPRFKIYDNIRGYIGSTKELIDAANLLVSLSEGGSIRNGHRRMDVLFDYDPNEWVIPGPNLPEAIADMCHKNLNVDRIPW